MIWNNEKLERKENHAPRVGQERGPALQPNISFQIYNFNINHVTPVSVSVMCLYLYMKFILINVCLKS